MKVRQIAALRLRFGLSQAQAALLACFIFGEGAA
jgi:hypothetical protein